MENRDSNGKFKKGNTFGSATQRTKGISAYINSKTNDLKDVVDELLLLYVDKRISVSNRIKIAEYLTAYSVGKPHQSQSIEVEAHKYKITDKKDEGSY